MEVKNENLRTVKVNAQVTAMISFSEIVGFLIITLVSTSLKSATAGEIMFPLLQNIILPYAFIINTRENKNNVIEQGWKNVLQNTLNIGSSSQASSTKGDDKNVDDDSNDNRVINTVSQKVQETSRNINDRSLQNSSSIERGLNRPMDEQSSRLKTKRLKTIRLKFNIFENSIELDDKKCNETNQPITSRSEMIETNPIENIGNSRKCKGRKELIQSLLSNRHKETVYVRTFTQLVNLEEGNAEEKRDQMNSPMVQEEIIMKTVSKLLQNGDRHYRIHMRKNMLQRLQLHQNDEHEYKEIFEELINIEEQFLNESEWD